jgi:hypothetical protein
VNELRNTVLQLGQKNQALQVIIRLLLVLARVTGDLATELRERRRLARDERIVNQPIDHERDVQTARSGN